MLKIHVVARLLLWVGVAIGMGAEIARGDEPLVSSRGSQVERLASSAPVLLSFHADWCGPCQSMRAVVETLARSGCAIQRINVDENPAMAKRYGVTSVPCFVVVENGREIDRVTGVTTVERLKLKLKQRSEISNLKSQIAAPHPAWRYERPVGYRAAVVRIYCQQGTAIRSIGSGALVRWSGRLVILTARHVIKGATKILVRFCTGRTHRAWVLSTDVVWDAAVLEVEGTPRDIEPAAVELGQRALQQEGNRLETCGYGSDGQLACNSGLFLGYRRNGEFAPNGPDDWMIVSGPARPGDSGGPVFDSRGRVVGVLWGTDGKEVVCVQAGRLHVLLETAVRTKRFQQQADVVSIPIERLPEVEVYETVQFPRHPTPPMSNPGDGCSGCPGGDCQLTAGAKEPALPWRRDTQKRDDSQDARIQALIELQERQARTATGPSVKVDVPAKESPKAEAKNPGASPLVAVACMVVAAGLAASMYYLTAKDS